MARTVYDHDTGEVLEIGPHAEGILDDLTILDPYAPGGVSLPRSPDWLATISAGTKNEKGLPVVSRDGKIFLSDPQNRAPRLAEILKANEYKHIDLAMPFDSINDCVKLGFRRRSQTRLEAYGNEQGITTIEANGAHEWHPAGTAEFEELRQSCKVECSVFFILAEWLGTTLDALEARYRWPDGWGIYRIRTTSRHSVHSIYSSLKAVEQLARGSFRGVPLRAYLVYRDVPGGDGKMRSVPIWTFTLKPPVEIELSSTAARAMVGAARREVATLLGLPAPTVLPTTDDEADDDGPTGDPTAALTEDPPADVEHWNRTFWASVKGTSLDDAAARAAFMLEHTDGKTDSLAEFWKTATESSASNLIAHMVKRIAAERTVGWPAPDTGKPSPTSTRRRSKTPEGAAYTPHLSPGQEMAITLATSRLVTIDETFQLAPQLKAMFDVETVEALSETQADTLIEWLAGRISPGPEPRFFAPKREDGTRAYADPPPTGNPPPATAAPITDGAWTAYSALVVLAQRAGIDIVKFADLGRDDLTAAQLAAKHAELQKLVDALPTQDPLKLPE
jgi:hypothetical protein